MSIITTVAKDLATRIEAVKPQAVCAELKNTEALDLVEVASSYLVMGIRKESTFVNLVADVGLRVRSKMGLKRDSVRSAHIGAFILESFETAGLFQRKLETNGRNEAYFIYADDEEALTELWDLVPSNKSDHTPDTKPAADWTSGVHATGLPLVRHGSKALLSQFNTEQHSMLFDVLNKNQNTGWQINSEVFKTYVSCFNNKEKATNDGEFAFGHDDPEEKKKARSSKRLEADTIRALARKMSNETFYHLYNCDFRGRVYPMTAFLHEQGSDNAKGLLLMSEGRPLGKDGLDWLSIYATNNWGNDKIALDARIEFCNENLEDWIAFAEAPALNKGWINADKCWSFLACCVEFKNIWNWVEAGNDVEDYVCRLPVYIDGSNNGVQWLTALSRDEVVAPLVNLVPQDIPGDVYAYIADKVWAGVAKNYDAKNDAELYEFMDAMAKITEKLETTKMTKEQFQVVIAEAKAYRDDRKELIERVTPNYWFAVSSRKEQRKVAKRPVMTLGYGGTKFGFKTQVLEDTKTISSHFRNMQYTWARYMGDMIFSTCVGDEKLGIDAALPGPAKMLKLFQDLAERSVDLDRKFAWNVPVTNFPVVQQYRFAETKRVDLTYLGARVQLTIKIMEKQKIKKSKQMSAAAPNVVHSYDAAHLVMTVNACKFPTATVHDSFGCLPTDMPEMFYQVRNQFVEFNKQDPLEKLLAAQDSLDLMPVRGNLVIESIMTSDFAFV